MQTIKVKNKESLKGEILRFVITGLVAAIVDFGFYTLTSFILQKIGMKSDSTWLTVISTIIGFIFGVIINYFLSVYWVFQNVDKKKQEENKERKVVVFVLLSAIGLLISIGIMAICKISFQKGLNINIDNWMNVGVPFSNLGKWLSLVLSSLTFWMYAISFILKTLGGLVFNYISRKKILFKKPTTK